MPPASRGGLATILRCGRTLPRSADAGRSCMAWSRRGYTLTIRPNPEAWRASPRMRASLRGPPRSDPHVRKGGGKAVDRFDEARVGGFEPFDRGGQAFEGGVGELRVVSHRVWFVLPGGFGERAMLRTSSAWVQRAGRLRPQSPSNRSNSSTGLGWQVGRVFQRGFNLFDTVEDHRGRIIPRRRRARLIIIVAK